MTRVLDRPWHFIIESEPREMTLLERECDPDNKVLLLSECAQTLYGL